MPPPARKAAKTSNCIFRVKAPGRPEIEGSKNPVRLGLQKYSLPLKKSGGHYILHSSHRNEVGCVRPDEVCSISLEQSRDETSTPRSRPGLRIPLANEKSDCAIMQVSYWPASLPSQDPPFSFDSTTATTSIIGENILDKQAQQAESNDQNGLHARCTLQYLDSATAPKGEGKKKTSEGKNVDPPSQTWLAAHVCPLFDVLEVDIAAKRGRQKQSVIALRQPVREDQIKEKGRPLWPESTAAQQPGWKGTGAVRDRRRGRRRKWMPTYKIRSALGGM
jgi:hypothetical protein